MRVNQANPGKNTKGKRRKTSGDPVTSSFARRLFLPRLFCRYVQTSPLFSSPSLFLLFFFYSLALLEQVDVVTGDELWGHGLVNLVPFVTRNPCSGVNYR